MSPSPPPRGRRGVRARRNGEKGTDTRGKCVRTHHTQDSTRTLPSVSGVLWRVWIEPWWVCGMWLVVDLKIDRGIASRARDVIGMRGAKLL